MPAPVLTMGTRLSRLGIAQGWLLAGALLTLTGSIIGLISALTVEDVPSYYIVRWNNSGKCSVLIEQPPQGNGRLLWAGNLQLSAESKLKEFIRMRKCR